MTTAFQTLKSEIEKLLATYGEDMGFGGPADMPLGLERALLTVQGKLMAAELDDWTAATGSPLPPTSTVQRLTIRPGDVIVITDPQRLSEQSQRTLRDWLQEVAGFTGVPVLVLDQGRSLDLLSSGASAAAMAESQTKTAETYAEMAALREQSGELFPAPAFVAADPERFPAAVLTDQELAAEIERVGAAFSEPCEGRSGSPLESLSERLSELETEKRRRDVQRRAAVDLTNAELLGEISRLSPEPGDADTTEAADERFLLVLEAKTRGLVAPGWRLSFAVPERDVTSLAVGDMTRAEQKYAAYMLACLIGDVTGGRKDVATEAAVGYLPGYRERLSDLMTAIARGGEASA